MKRLQSNGILVDETGEQTQLRALAFRLLQVLVAADGELVSFDELIVAAWGEEAGLWQGVSDECLQQQISYLRKVTGLSIVAQRGMQAYRLVDRVEAQDLDLDRKLRLVIVQLDRQQQAAVLRLIESLTSGKAAWPQ